MSNIDWTRGIILSRSTQYSFFASCWFLLLIYMEFINIIKTIERIRSWWWWRILKRCLQSWRMGNYAILCLLCGDSWIVHDVNSASCSAKIRVDEGGRCASDRKVQTGVLNYARTNYRSFGAPAVKLLYKRYLQCRIIHCSSLALLLSPLFLRSLSLPLIAFLHTSSPLTWLFLHDGERRTRVKK